jgi:hypothetical protein
MLRTGVQWNSEYRIARSTRIGARQFSGLHKAFAVAHGAALDYLHEHGLLDSEFELDAVDEAVRM